MTEQALGTVFKVIELELVLKQLMCFNSCTDVYVIASIVRHFVDMLSFITFAS